MQNTNFFVSIFVKLRKYLYFCIINSYGWVAHFFIIFFLKEKNAKRKAKFKADKKMIIDAFAEMAKEKNIDRDLYKEL